MSVTVQGEKESSVFHPTNREIYFGMLVFRPRHRPWQTCRKPSKLSLTLNGISTCYFGFWTLDFEFSRVFGFWTDLRIWSPKIRFFLVMWSF